jgi:hypothetical protein
MKLQPHGLRLALVAMALGAAVGIGHAQPTGGQQTNEGFSARWTAPGYYEVFYTTDTSYTIWSGPYDTESQCIAYVKNRFADPAYAERMRRKWGTFGDRENGFVLYCFLLKTKEDAGPD